MRRLLSAALALLLGASLLSCSPWSGTGSYQPLPQWEKKFFDMADRRILPGDAVGPDRKYSRTLVAWAGIIKEIRFEAEAEFPVMRIIAEHRYFNWMAQHGPSGGVLYPSLRGEGLFAAVWRIERPEDREFAKRFSVGDMVIAYGYPTIMRGGMLHLFPTQNIRGFKPGEFNAEQATYGRPDEQQQKIPHSAVSPQAPQHNAPPGYPAAPGQGGFPQGYPQEIPPDYLQGPEGPRDSQQGGSPNPLELLQ